MHLYGVILDIDGTLIDSNDAHALSWVEALASHGLRVPFEAVRPLIGMGGDKVLAALVDVDADGEQGRAIKALRVERFRARLAELRPFTGARALVERLLQRGHELVVGTSAESDLVDALLDVAEVRDLLPKRTTSDDAERSKPDPDIVEAAADALDTSAARVMLGDTPYDLAAAHSAGHACIAIRAGGWWTDAAFASAAAIYDDPAHLLRELDRSPLAAPPRPSRRK
ncbi:HAD family hydrolase [Myxococcota bacterium]|nr:HAD family hydrolase [Myxococcota bacterium]